MANSTLARTARETPRRLPALSAPQRPAGRRRFAASFMYFGKWADDPKGEAALPSCGSTRRTIFSPAVHPAVHRDGLTVADLCNHFLTAKEQQRDAGDITPPIVCRLLRDVQVRGRFVRQELDWSMILRPTTSKHCGRSSPSGTASTDSAKKCSESARCSSTATTPA